MNEREKWQVACDAKLSGLYNSMNSISASMAKIRDYEEYAAGQHLKTLNQTVQAAVTQSLQGEVVNRIREVQLELPALKKELTAISQQQADNKLQLDQLTAQNTQITDLLQILIKQNSRSFLNRLSGGKKQ